MKESLVTVNISDCAIMKNEVGYIVLGDARLKAEVLRIQGDFADLQVFEDTNGVRVGDEVELTGELLSVWLGPGLLGQVFDGLQVPLAVLAADHGFFLPRGVSVPPLDKEKRWRFEPSVATGAVLVWRRGRPVSASGSIPTVRLFSSAPGTPTVPPGSIRQWFGSCPQSTGRCSR